MERMVGVGEEGRRGGGRDTSQWAGTRGGVVIGTAPHSSTAVVCGARQAANCQYPLGTGPRAATREVPHKRLSGAPPLAR